MEARAAEDPRVFGLPFSHWSAVWGDRELGLRVQRCKPVAINLLKSQTSFREADCTLESQCPQDSRAPKGLKWLNHRSCKENKRRLSSFLGFRFRQDSKAKTCSPCKADAGGQNYTEKHISQMARGKSARKMGGYIGGMGGVHGGFRCGFDHLVRPLSQSQSAKFGDPPDRPLS